MSCTVPEDLILMYRIKTTIIATRVIWFVAVMCRLLSSSIPDPKHTQIKKQVMYDVSLCYCLLEKHTPVLDLVLPSTG